MTVLPDDGLTLASEFPEAPHEQWQHLVAGVLRKSGKELSGDAAEDALSTLLEDGLDVRPLYTAATARETAPGTGLPGFAPFVRGGRAEGNTLAALGRTPAAPHRRQRRGPRRPGERRHLPLAGRRRHRHPGRLARHGPRRGVPRPGTGRPRRGRRDRGCRRAPARAVRGAGRRRRRGPREPGRGSSRPRGPHRPPGVRPRVRGRTRAPLRRPVPGPAGPDRGRPAVPRGRMARPRRNSAAPSPPASPICGVSPRPG